MAARFDDGSGFVSAKRVTKLTLQLDHSVGAGQSWGAVANVVGIRRGAISGNMSVSAQAARSIG